ncbi:DeoR/GlpR family DNA-binding transcription regulator [Amycolatopsis sp. WQ 127309]|uniref:DeoR/GlpR family DNA-binding transcription regulator n=1 Tax=Amycolatopsis sp. WQ 127309 TaxID=2932773 RepID=UPI001FF4152D|nr:DeoR/GlpR family DNA-binding transcription regulator [Amycolatopsis sp. WQ 127309]UOZ05557.1 DeoR/GlpR family DNA-binding transcription regulator [Amycolatopsis sp. WQ 127309]
MSLSDVAVPLVNERPRGRTSRSERMSEILRELSETGSLHVGDLARRFGVSEATLRRDLTALEDQRLLTRTHGGALAQGVAYELPVRYREGRSRDAKRAIAREAVRRLPAGPHVIGLTGGSTTGELAKELPDRLDLTVVTNALNTAMDIVLRPRVKLVVVGGVSRPRSYELVGPWAEQVLASINIGTAFIGVDGIDAEGGITTHDENEARTNRAMLSRAQRVVVVADGSKLGRRTLARIADIGEVHELITDASAGQENVAVLRAAGVRVTVV